MYVDEDKPQVGMIQVVMIKDSMLIGRSDIKV